MADEGQHQHMSHHHHFLVVGYGAQSHVNPGRVLAHRLTRLGVDGGSILATLSVPLATHRRMFPSLDDGAEETTNDGVISYAPYSDGVDDGSMVPQDAEDRERRRRASFRSLSAIVARLADRGKPVTCIMCTTVLLPVLDVARELGIPLAIYWIQPATVLAVTYHYIHGHGENIASHATDPDYEVRLPGLSRPLRIRNFPSFLVETRGSEKWEAVNSTFKELFEYLDQWQPKVLVNTFNELEATVLEELKQHLNVCAIGPMVGSLTEARIHLFKLEDAEKNRYMEWLGTQPDKSAVYVSFGSTSKYTKQQMEEIVHGLRQCGRPYLLVVRKDGLEEDAISRQGLLEIITQDQQGMVVDWCNQLEVLSHPAVGCFVSHCGWNSTLEGVVLGVPIVGVPSAIDQPTNAYLVKEEWMIGTRAERNDFGLVTGSELARCIELVMDEGAQATMIRERVTALKGTSQEIAAAGGLADKNLQDFVNTIKQNRSFSLSKSIKS